MLLTEAGSADGPIPFAKLRKKSERGILPPCFTWLGGKDSVKRAPHRPYQQKARSHKTLFQGNTTTESCLPKLALEFPPSHNGFLLDWLQSPSSTTCRKPNHQPTGNHSTDHREPTDRPKGTIQQTTGNHSTDHSNLINKLPCIPHKFMPSEAPRCIRHRSALHQPSQRAAQAHAAHCLSRSGKMGTDKKHIISPQHCAATRHIRTPTAKEASRGLPDMPLPHIKTEGQPHG